MLGRVKAKQPAARLSGFTLEPMVNRPLAQELIVGVSEDIQFGPVILFGHGGVAVETIGDRAIALPPLNLKLARELMERTRVYRLLSGFRDRPPAALDQIALVLLKVSQLTVDFGEIVELDINPLLADHEGVLALDARIRVRRFDRPAAARLSIRPYPSELEETLTIADGTGSCCGRSGRKTSLSSLPVSRNCRRNRSACVSSRPCESCPTAWQRG